MAQAGPAPQPVNAAMAAARWLRWIGASGALLALVILGASMFLRLATIFGADGHPISTLSASLESAIRLSHRLAASGVALLAVFAAFLYWRRQPLPAGAGRPIALFIAMTILLAVIGPLTPGYRLTLITVGNVAGGMILLMAFWWLRECVRAWVAAPSAPAQGQTAGPLVHVAIFIFIAHVAAGAAASAQEMHGVRWMSLVHLGSAILAVMFIGAYAWQRHREPAVIALTAVITGLLAALLALGSGQLWLDARPVWLAFSHGMLSPLLAIALVSLAVRDS